MKKCLSMKGDKGGSVSKEQSSDCLAPPWESIIYNNLSMYSVYVKPNKWKKKKQKNPNNEYKQVMNRRINFVQDRIKKEKEKNTEFKYF